MTEVPKLVDRPALLAARRRARASGGGPDFLTARVSEDMIDRLAATLRPFARAVDLASPTPAIAAALLARPEAALVARASFDPAEACDVAVAPDALPFAPESLDLVVSILALQFVDDLPGLFAQARRALRPDGMLLAAFLGGDTLTELRQAFAIAEAETTGGASPRVMPSADVRAVGGLLQRAGFALPVTDVDRVTVRYPDPLELMRDLRAWGATNALAERSRRFLRRDTLAKALQVYAERFSDPDGRARATFEIVWASGWAPHPDQQKPLKPGSAKTRLADALAAPSGNPAAG